MSMTAVSYMWYGLRFSSKDDTDDLETTLRKLYAKELDGDAYSEDDADEDIDDDWEENLSIDGVELEFFVPCDRCDNVGFGVELFYGTWDSDPWTLDSMLQDSRAKLAKAKRVVDALLLKWNIDARPNIYCHTKYW